MQSHPGVQPKIVPAFECVSKVAFLPGPQSQQQLVTNFLSKGIQQMAIIRTYASLRTRTLTRVRLFTTSSTARTMIRPITCPRRNSATDAQQLLAPTSPPLHSLAVRAVVRQLSRFGSDLH